MESLTSLFMARRTDAASSNWTCWCFEMRSFDVTDHSGVCSHLERQECQYMLFTDAEPCPIYSEMCHWASIVQVAWVMKQERN